MPDTLLPLISLEPFQVVHLLWCCAYMEIYGVLLLHFPCFFLCLGVFDVSRDGDDGDCHGRIDRHRGLEH